MNLNQILNLLLRLVMREGRRRARSADRSPEDRARSRQVAGAARRTGQAARILRMFRRFR